MIHCPPAVVYPCQHLQKFYVIKYQPGDKYDPHMDPHDNAESGQESKRVATVVVYLNDVGSGGETLFPREGRDGELNSPSRVDTAARLCKPPGCQPSSTHLIWAAFAHPTKDGLAPACQVLHGDTHVKTLCTLARSFPVLESALPLAAGTSCKACVLTQGSPCCCCVSVCCCPCPCSC